MAEVILDLRTLDNAEKVQCCLMQQLDLPFYYGKNLDALYDELMAWNQQTTFVMLLPQQLAGGMADYFPRLIRVFKDAAHENPAISIEVRS
ncbi:MAG: barstar family protein [Clostridia bacterium]|nr:barstar family protein [Clostridia bacterium]